MTMTSTEVQAIDAFEIRKEMVINAPIDIAYQTILDVLGPDGEMPGGKPFPMILEAWPGGRWYRDLGDNAGHLWGHVQAIKPPTLIELWGPLMMSFGACNNLQYRLTAEGNVTRVAFHHRAVGAMIGDMRDGFPQGWGHWLDHMKDLAERRHNGATK